MLERFHRVESYWKSCDEHEGTEYMHWPPHPVRWCPLHDAVVPKVRSKDAGTDDALSSRVGG